MDFPTYVPSAVRDLLAAQLDGRGADAYDTGWRGALASAQQELQRLEALRQDVQDPTASDNLRTVCAEQRLHRDALAENVASLERLALRPDMQPAYSKLVGCLATDGELKAFVRAAWQAHIDYGEFRNRIRAASEVAKSIADAAKHLMNLLQKAEGFGAYLPGELFSLRALLKSAEHDPADRDFHMWRGLRHMVLGEPRAARTESAQETPLDPVRIVFRTAAAELDPAEEARNSLAYAWNTAPSVRQAIAAMQRSAENCAPSETGAIGAALSSQKRNRKTEYLRAFASLLHGENGFALTPDIMNAMAFTAAVVLDDPEIDVNYDDVRKAVAASTG